MMPRLIAWLAGFFAIIDLVLIFPYAWWVFTGILLVPPYPQVIRHIDLDSESNLITWYSSLLLLLVAEVSLANFILDSIERNDRTWLRYAWLGIFGVTLFLSLDEVAQIHESVSVLVKQARAVPGSIDPAAGVVDNKTWVLAYLPGILVVVGGLLFVFLRVLREWRGPRLLGLGGLALWVSSLILEFFGAEFAGVWKDKGLLLENLLEEGCEIFGTTALLVAFAWYGMERLSLILSHRNINKVDLS